MKWQDEVDTNRQHDRLLYPVPVLDQLAQTGELGTPANPYGYRVVADMESAKQQQPNSRVRLSPQEARQALKEARRKVEVLRHKVRQGSLAPPLDRMNRT